MSRNVDSRMSRGEDGSTFPAWSRARAVAALVPSVPAVVCPQHKAISLACHRSPPLVPRIASPAHSVPRIASRLVPRAPGVAAPRVRPSQAPVYLQRPRPSHACLGSSRRGGARAATPRPLPAAAGSSAAPLLPGRTLKQSGNQGICPSFSHKAIIRIVTFLHYDAILIII